MLYLETVTSHTFSILEKLLDIPELIQFGLVGGTALSLLYGHRISEDLDIFSVTEFDNDKIARALTKEFKSEVQIRNTCLLYTSRCV